ncbi:hypothetical protein ALQ08_200169 [Pseudomonas syringae pv. delphinii]|uniref:Uncharacterized protein n=1 Tax=Pseudomonas syringae pv. delphinii TaxID=192088 RepID=A0A0P9PNS9_9PSED|nr:hypothetical protein [Pseudomonas syringae group genomosp. 3]KPX12908.1 hypothetical protein ALO72_200234 [Pseudomonas syringae pv. delphinii]RMQ16020.1 hypothetical protein ALQ08_200169 [Pseudomonas syringae pv. delphinii]
MKWNEKWMWAAIVFYIASVAGVYIFNLHDYPFSKSPGDWGTIGDYFGGLINPLTSLIALYFLIKAYLSQKEELSATKSALEESAKHQEALAKAQILSIQAAAKFEEIKFWSSEAERCTIATNNDRKTWDLNGKQLFTDKEIHGYRLSCFDMMNKLLKESKLLQVEVEGLRKQP